MIHNKNFPFLKVENLSCFLKNKIILDSISFSIEKGEFVVIFGNNGSGKSTLAKHFNALYLPDEGEVFVDGINTKSKENYYDIKRKVSFMFQIPDHQIISDNIEEDVAFGPENLGFCWEDIRKNVDNSLKLVELYNNKHQYISTLSGGNKQKLVLAGALAIGSEALILDEPTSMLDYENRKIIINNILKLNKENNVTVILLTHNLEDLMIADRMLILDQGKLVSDIKNNEFMNSKFFLKNKFKCKLNIKKKINKKEKIVIKNVSFGYKNSKELIFDKVNINIYDGEILGIVGESGSGKTTFVNLIKGILKPNKGEIIFKDKNDMNYNNPKIGLAFQYAENQFFEESIIKDVMFGPLNIGFTKDKSYLLAKEALNYMDIKEDQFDISPFKLSGGEMKKVSIAGIIAMKPEILILDEPTAGLDYFSRCNFLDLILKLNKETNNTIIVISHLYEDLRSICDRIISMKNIRNLK